MSIIRRVVVGWRALALGVLAVRLWKHWRVVRFFRRAAVSPRAGPELVSIMQPILSGDPFLESCLRRNLATKTGYQREWLWLIDDDDAEAQRLHGVLAAEFPGETIRMIVLPPPPQRTNPKLWKLRAGLAHIHGTMICVLDDDTSLPDWGLEQALPLLDAPNAGLVFGLPFYRSFDTPWSALVALFVNSNSLPTYTSYIALTEPFTINGMFYALRRDTLAQIGDFAGLEGVLADDFAVAQRVRKAGLRLIQSPLRHAVATHVPSAARYRSLLQRWFIFPRESLLRHLRLRELLVLQVLTLLPTLFPVLLALATLLDRSRWQRWYMLLYMAHSVGQFAHLNRAYLGDATPWRYLPLVPLVEAMTPAQVLVALLSPQRIVWRGHVMDVEPGGGFRFVQRRSE